MRALRSSRDTLRNVSRPSPATFGLAQRPESLLPPAPPEVPPPPPARPAPSPKLVWDAGTKRTIVKPPPVDAAEEVEKLPPQDAGPPEPEPEPAPQTSVK